MSSLQARDSDIVEVILAADGAGSICDGRGIVFVLPALVVQRALDAAFRSAAAGSWDEEVAATCVKIESERLAVSVTGSNDSRTIVQFVRALLDLVGQSFLGTGWMSVIGINDAASVDANYSCRLIGCALPPVCNKLAGREGDPYLVIALFSMAIYSAASTFWPVEALRGRATLTGPVARAVAPRSEARMMERIVLADERRLREVGDNENGKNRPAEMRAAI